MHPPQTHLTSKDTSNSPNVCATMNSSNSQLPHPFIAKLAEVLLNRLRLTAPSHPLVWTVHGKQAKFLPLEYAKIIQELETIFTPSEMQFLWGRLMSNCLIQLHGDWRDIIHSYNGYVRLTEKEEQLLNLSPMIYTFGSVTSSTNYTVQSPTAKSYGLMTQSGGLANHHSPVIAPSTAPSTRGGAKLPTLHIHSANIFHLIQRRQLASSTSAGRVRSSSITTSSNKSRTDWWSPQSMTVEPSYTSNNTWLFSQTGLPIQLSFQQIDGTFDLSQQNPYLIMWFDHIIQFQDQLTPETAEALQTDLPPATILDSEEETSDSWGSLLDADEELSDYSSFGDD
ncbi:hypothetical protein [Yerba mate-associated circular DNA virus 1]|uniref:Uncharacterized protein n=1 Tax=Yerba mate-associated circular DNA virus 1 TaxID=2219873 RepID=A0A2Z4ELF7_9VIRU|nr:hypothetical protein QKT95_gp4 [Yerba mate-associated circular DNA virus 1]AWV57062.1 hypothetical protein [Yerba mate-associated circular DNA virus 1]